MAGLHSAASARPGAVLKQGKQHFKVESQEEVAVNSKQQTSSKVLLCAARLQQLEIDDYTSR